jgi:protein-disulfide isomerase
MVYNWQDDTRLEGRTLIGIGPNARKKGGVLLILIALLGTLSPLTGCGGAGSGGSSQPSKEQQASRTADSAEPEDEESSGKASGGRLGHPALGNADAPVVLTEYSDYQ